jgi:hypothetical protein
MKVDHDKPEVVKNSYQASEDVTYSNSIEVDLIYDQSWMAIEKDQLPTLEQLREKKRKKFNRRKQKGVSQWMLNKRK